MPARFVDRVIINIRGGKGGNGIVAFRREANVPKGGPSGGNGGRGGCVNLIVNPKLTTLIDFRSGSLFRAENGVDGGPSNRTGRRGADLDLDVPPGTSVFHNETGLMLGDLIEPGQTLVVARGGSPGKGNASFASSTRQAPRKATRGQPGEELQLRLELALIADVGLVGLPNAGKSTLLSRVSAARPKIADYPFTTLHPCLGVVRMERGFSFVIADLPGLIEGASEGLGLGHRFLRHVCRNRILVYMVAADLPETPLRQLEIVRDEIHRYNPELNMLEEVVVLSKIDLLDESEIIEIIETLGESVFPLSSITGSGVKPFLGHLSKRVAALREKS